MYVEIGAVPQVVTLYTRPNRLLSGPSEPIIEAPAAPPVRHHRQHSKARRCGVYGKMCVEGVTVTYSGNKFSALLKRPLQPPLSTGKFASHICYTNE